MTENWLLFSFAALIALVVIARIIAANAKDKRAGRNPRPARGAKGAPASVPPMTAMPPTALESQEARQQ